jgi:chromosome segregation ATPase
MSAYVKGPGSHVISLPGAAKGIPIPEKLDRFSVLPQIVSELEAYFSVSRQMESTLEKERAEKKKYQDQVLELQAKLDQLSVEMTGKIQYYTAREEELKAQIVNHEEREKQLKKAESDLARERAYRAQYEAYVKDLHAKYVQLTARAKESFKNQALHEEQLKAQLRLQHRNEKSLQDRIDKLTRQVDELGEEKRKNELEAELMKSKFQHAKEREDALKAELQSFRYGQRSQTDQVSQLMKELHVAKTRLHQYYQAWSQMDARSKQVSQESVSSKQRLEELSESLSTERRRSEHLEELMKKEKREKQVALSCLHTAESRLAQANRALEEIRVQRTNTVQDRGLEINF